MTASDPNPYAPPTAPVVEVQVAHAAGSPGELEAIRKEHIRREANVKAIGSLQLFYAGAGLVALSLFAHPLYSVPELILTLVLAPVSILFGLAGYWTRSLLHRGRVLTSVMMSLSIAFYFFKEVLAALVQWPVGGGFVSSFVIPVAILFVLWDQRASTVFSDHYRDVVIPATPHIKPSSRVAIVVAVLLVLLTALIVVVALMGA